MSLLAGSVQPAVLTLLSSTSRPPLSPLWDVTEGAGESAFVVGLRDDELAHKASTSIGGKTIQPERHVPRHAQAGSLPVPVIHLQSPRPDTFIATKGTLGVTLPYLGMQLKPLGSRGLSIEVEMADASGRRGVVRLSSWKKHPSLHLRTPPLVHLPLALPSDAHKVTDWAELNLYLPPIMGLFRSLKAEEEDSSSEEEERRGWQAFDRKRSHPQSKQKSKPRHDLPTGYASTAAMRIYASCRVRRVWFSAEGDKSLDVAGVRDEWALYAKAE